jgi:O-acetyl-ADP-ribose deacetylase (regulator of RNase III)
MHQDGVAYRFPFRIQRALHDERAVVRALGEHGAGTAALKTKAKLAAPALIASVGSEYRGVRFGDRVHAPPLSKGRARLRMKTPSP